MKTLTRVDHQDSCDIRRRTPFGDHSDPAKRISDTYRLHRQALGAAAIGKFFASALADGTTDGQLYDTKRDAVRHQHHNEQLFMFLAIGPYDLSPCEAEELLAIQRVYYDRGIRWPDPDHARGGPEVIQRATVEDQRSLVRSIASGGRLRPSGLVYPGELSMVATQTKPAPGAGSTGAGQAVPVKPWPFPVGVFEQDVQDIDISVTQTTSAQLWSEWNLSPTGWLRGAWLDFLMSVSGNVTNNVTFSKDNPFSVVQKLTVYDLGGEVVIQLTGYQWMLVNKFGGYFNVGDPRGDVNYSATTGTGGTAGSFHFVLYVPLEIIARSALGVVQNESKPGWRIELYIDSQANTYNQVPSVQGTLRVRGYTASYTDTAPANYVSGNTVRPFSQSPPLPGTLQYWKTEGATLIAAGSAKYDLTNGIGFPIRNVFYLFYDASAGTRAAGDGDIPDPFVLNLGNLQLYNRSVATYFAEMGRDYAFYGVFAGIANSNDNAFARENGVLPFYRTLDFANEPGNEYGYKYWATNVNTLLRLQGSFGAQVNLFAMVNWIQTPSKNRYQLISGGPN